MIEITLQTQNLNQVIKTMRRMRRDINRTFVKEFRREVLTLLRPVGRRAIQRIRTRAPVDSGYYRKSWRMRVLKKRELPDGGGVVIRPVPGKPPATRRGVATGFGLAALLEGGADGQAPRPHYRREVREFNREGRREARQFLNSRIRLLKRRWRGY